MKVPAVRFFVQSMTDTQLQATLAQKTRICGTTLKEETGTVFRGILRQAVTLTPPGSQRGSGPAAKAAGEAAIGRDLRLMGFAPKEIKGFRIITKAFGHPIEPVRVKTKVNPAFADPDAFHQARLRARTSGKVSRGRRQPFYVSKAKFNSMIRRLKQEVGLLASGWAAAALDMGVTVPAFIKRHWASGRGSQVQIVETPTRFSIKVTNHFPETAEKEASQTRRLIAFLKKAAIGRLKRQLPYILRRKLQSSSRT